MIHNVETRIDLTAHVNNPHTVLFEYKVKANTSILEVKDRTSFDFLPLDSPFKQFCEGKIRLFLFLFLFIINPLFYKAIVNDQNIIER